MIKGHVQKRQAEYRKLNHHSPLQTGEANLDGWAQLAAIAEQSGALQRGGERLVS